MPKRWPTTWWPWSTASLGSATGSHCRSACCVRCMSALAGVRGQHRRPGAPPRSSPNWIGGTSLENAVFGPRRRTDARPCPRGLGTVPPRDRDLPLLVQLALAHYQFEAIHPFLDGNGRIGRLVIPLMLVRGAAAPTPPVPLGLLSSNTGPSTTTTCSPRARTATSSHGSSSSCEASATRHATPKSERFASSSSRLGSATNFSTRDAPTRSSGSPRTCSPYPSSMLCVSNNSWGLPGRLLRPPLMLWSREASSQR